MVVIFRIRVHTCGELRNVSGETCFQYPPKSFHDATHSFRQLTECDLSLKQGGCGELRNVSGETCFQYPPKSFHDATHSFRQLTECDLSLKQGGCGATPREALEFFASTRFSRFCAPHHLHRMFRNVLLVVV